MSGFSYPTVAKGIADLGESVARESNRSVQLHSFPRRKWDEWLAVAPRIRRSVYFRDRSGTTDLDYLRRRIERARPEGLAIGGVVAARHWHSRIDLDGLPRLDVELHAPEGSADYGFVSRLDPALVRADPRTTAVVLAVHVLHRARPLFERGKGEPLPYATPPVLADGGDATLIHACVKNANGQVRIVGPNDGCLPSESSLHWAAGASANTAGSIMVHGVTAGVGGDPVVFVHYGGGIPVYRSPRAGVIQNMRVLVRANSYDGDTPVTLMVNGVATAISTVIPAGSTVSIDVPGTVAIADGDQVSLVMDRGASSSGTLEISVAYEVL